MQTAPVSPREPPAISTCPELNLVESAPRWASRASTEGWIRPAGGAPGAPSGIPMRATSSRPVWRLPGAIQWPSLAAWKLTVTSASTAAPATSPVEASTPEAMSAATAGAGQSLIASIAAAAGSRGAPEKPVPKIASTTTPEPSSAAAASPPPSSRTPRLEAFEVRPRVV